MRRSLVSSVKTKVHGGVSFGRLVATQALALIGLCAFILADAQGGQARAQSVSLATSSFALPRDGAPNNNETIGDFCCTGRTAKVVTSSGDPVGYIYFHDFRGGVNYGDGASGMTDAGILLSGIRDSSDPFSSRARGAVWFSAAEILRGVREKSRRVGALNFKARVTRADIRDGRVLMDGFAVRVSVAVVDTAGGAATTCRDSVQGRIAWNYEGDTAWAERNLARLCAGAEASREPGKCFKEIMHGGVDWGGGAQWRWQNAIDLCEGTHNADATIRCFRDRISAGSTWSAAILACQSR